MLYSKVAKTKASLTSVLLHLKLHQGDIDLCYIYPCSNAVYLKYTFKQLEKYTLFVLKAYFKYT